MDGAANSEVHKPNIGRPVEIEEETAACEQSIRQPFDMLCDQARVDGWSELAIGRALMKLATRKLKDAFEAK